MRDYFKDKTAVVTGAASGFGLGISRRLLEYGAKNVWMADFNRPLLDREAGKLEKAYPGRVTAVAANSMVRADVEGLVTRAANESERLDFIFNNAGRPMTKPSEDLTVEEFEDLIKLNYMGVMYGVLSALRIMLPQGSGHIVNTASCGGLLPAPFQAAYASTKAAVITMTRCMAYEYHGSGIYFSQISPMNVATNIFGAELGDKLRREGKSEKEIERATAGIKPPEGAMPIEDALDEVFDGIEAKRTDIIFGQDGRDAYKLFCTDRPSFDRHMLELAEKRSVFYAAIKHGEDAVFPG